MGDILPGNPLYGDLRGAQILEMPERAPDYASGLTVGDVIVAIDSAAVRTTDDLLRRIEQAALQYRVDFIRNGIPAWMRVTK